MRDTGQTLEGEREEGKRETKKKKSGKRTERRKENENGSKMRIRSQKKRPEKGKTIIDVPLA